MAQLVQSQRVAIDVAKRLNLINSPQMQEQFRNSESFGRESIDQWVADSILPNVAPGFINFSNVLAIKYKSGDPNQGALLANAFLAATIDASIAMKAASADQTARWFAPQIESRRKELDQARAALEAFQAQTNVVAPTGGADTESAALMSSSAQLTSARDALSALQNRLKSDETTDLSTDPSDPDLQLLAGLKENLTAAQTAFESCKNSLGAYIPRIAAQSAFIAALRKQIPEATAKMHEHLKDRIGLLEKQIASMEASKAEALKTVIAVQAQRHQLDQLQQEVAFRTEQLNAEEKMSEQAKLQSKLTFGNIAVLDKATPPTAPAFPKPRVVIPVSIGAGLFLGLVLALIAEMTDRRVRFPIDLESGATAPFLGAIRASKLPPPLGGRPRLRLGAA